MLQTLGVAINYAVEAFVLLIIIRAVLSFFPNIDRHHPLVQTLDKIVDPVLRPFQRVLPPMGGLDFSPILAILTLQIVGRLVAGLLSQMGSGF